MWNIKYISCICATIPEAGTNKDTISTEVFGFILCNNALSSYRTPPQRLHGKHTRTGLQREQQANKTRHSVKTRQWNTITGIQPWNYNTSWKPTLMAAFLKKCFGCTAQTDAIKGAAGLAGYAWGDPGPGSRVGGGRKYQRLALNNCQEHCVFTSHLLSFSSSRLGETSLMKGF